MSLHLHTFHFSIIVVVEFVAAEFGTLARPVGSPIQASSAKRSLFVVEGDRKRILPPAP